MSQTPWPISARTALAIMFGVLFGLSAYMTLAPDEAITHGRDFAIPWLAANAILRHVDAYTFVRQGPTPPYGHIMFYPLTAGVVALPLAGFRVEIAGAIFVGVSASLLAFALSAGDPWRLLVLASAPMARAVAIAQWSPLLTAAALLTPALGLVAVKPNLALPLLTMQTRWRDVGFAIIGGGVLILVALALQPTWPLRWFEQFRDSLSAQYQIPVLHPLGVVTLLAAFRWRRADARLVLAMACVPQTTIFYEQLPLLLVPKSRREIVGMVVVSDIASLIAANRFLGGSVLAMHRSYYPWMIAGVYLPALAIVLRRPNLDDGWPWSREASK